MAELSEPTSVAEDDLAEASGAAQGDAAEVARGDEGEVQQQEPSSSKRSRPPSKQKVQRKYEASCSGILHDLLSRSKSKAGHAKLPAAEWLFDTMRSVLDPSTFGNAKSMFLREQLAHQFTCGIVNEYKERGIFKKSKLDSWKQQCQAVRLMKHEGASIRTRVENFDLVQAMIRNAQQDSTDTTPETEARLVRAERMEESWAQKSPLPKKRCVTDCDQDMGSTKGSILPDIDSRPQSPSHRNDPLDNQLPALKVTPKHKFGWVRHRQLRDRAAALDPEHLPPEQLSGQKPAPMQAKKTPGWRNARLTSSPVSQSKPSSALWSESQSKSWRSRPMSAWSSALRDELDDTLSLSNLNLSRAPSVLSFPESSIFLFGSASLPSLDIHAREDQPRPSIMAPAPGISNTRGKLPSIQDHYINSCKIRATVPTPVSVLEGSSKFDGREIMDRDLLSILGVLGEGPDIDDIAFSNNQLITDKGLAPFLCKVHELSMHLNLISLDLHQCRRAGPASLNAASSLLRDARKLKCFDISGMSIAVRLQRMLCDAVGAHPCLETLNLSQTGLGGNRHALDCIQAVTSSVSITSLDLSWNTFNPVEMHCLATQVVQSPQIKRLILDRCAASAGESDSSIADLIEILGQDRTLSYLSLALNHIDYKVALVVEDAIEFHPQLREINLKNNPLGTFGMRSLLRLISRNTNDLKTFNCEGCFSGAPDEGDETGEVCAVTVFSFTNPCGRYVLDLSRPCQRTMLRMLYKTCERYKVAPDKQFRDITYSLGQYSHATKSSNVFQVPNTGIISFAFSVESQLEENMKDVADTDFLGFLRKHFELTRFHPDKAKVVPLFAKWKEIDGRLQEQTVFLDALASDFNISVPYLQVLCSCSRSTLNMTMNALLPAIPDDGNSRYLALQLFPKIQDFCATFVLMEPLLLFNAQNPTGHYKLDLSNRPDFAVAQRLLLLDRWETVVNKRYNRVDISARGNLSHVRNELIGGRPLMATVASVAEWSLPEQGEFELDYVTSARPAASSKPLTDKLWERLMVNMYESDCAPKDKLKVLRSISHFFFISAKHMRQMMGYFDNPLHREEAFVMFYCRISDMQNIKMCCARFGKEEEVASLRRRLGNAFFFPFLQPENATFELNLSYNDQRLCGNMIVALGIREKMGNIRDAVWIKADGVEDVFPMGIPRSWETHIPDFGVFKCQYVCSADDRQFGFRKQLAQKYGYLAQEFSEKDINWWTGLNEPPADVIDLLEFLISRVRSMDEAFDIIDGGEPGCTANSELTLREFESGVKSMGCKKFEGRDEMARIAAVFRYLDPGGEGTVSKKEWMVLEQLWCEFDLTIKEFVQFLQFAFGPDLSAAWDALDEDGGGELTEDEFLDGAKAIGYFGPAEVVFALLDGSDDGSISYDEFAVLEKYKPVAN